MIQADWKVDELIYLFLLFLLNDFGDGNEKKTKDLLQNCIIQMCHEGVKLLPFKV